MAFKVPTCWKELSEEQLRHIIRLLWVNQDRPDGDFLVRSAALTYFCNIEVVSRSDKGWMCRERKTGRAFLLDPDLLPAMMEQVEWVTQPEKITVRIGRVGEYEAVDFELRDLMFGKYLMCENYYQAFLLTKEEGKLVKMARILYRIPDDEDSISLSAEILAGVFLWYSAAKQLLGEAFPHFFKPPEPGGGGVSMESQRDSVRAQIRLLTKGDVTKQDYIMNHTDTWAALGELDALAMEAEEIKQKYGKK